MTASQFNPPFSEHLYFVALDQKQNTQKGIEKYRAAIDARSIQKICDEISDLTHRIAQCRTLLEFQDLIDLHEKVISRNFRPFDSYKTSKEIYFPNFWGSVKSLGAWGGDMVLITSDRSEMATRQYFIDRGYNIILNYNDIIYQHPKTE